MKKIAWVLSAAIVSASLVSFTVKLATSDFLKELGITQSQADSKITNSILGGYLDAYGVKNAKNIALGNRTQVALDLLAYTKKHTSSTAFLKEYNDLKQRNKPEEQKAQTPEEMKNDMLKAYRKSLADAEGYVKTANEQMKPTFQKLVDDTKKMIKELEDGTNKGVNSYTKNYPGLVKMTEESNQRQLQTWEEKFPADSRIFIKRRLQQFLDVTANVDYDAEIVLKNNKKLFVKPEYERKSNQWKMAFRAGKEVTEPARKFVEDWLSTL